MFGKVLMIAKKVNPFLIAGTILVCLLNNDQTGAIIGLMLLGLLELSNISAAVKEK